MSSLVSPSLEIEAGRVHHAVVAVVIAILLVVPWFIARLTLSAAAVLMCVTSLIALFLFWRIGWLGGRRAIQKAIWSGEGDWHLVDRAGSSFSGLLASDSRVMGRMVWLRFASDLGPREILCFGPVVGQADTDDTMYRRLIVRLRLEAARSAAPTAIQIATKSESDAAQ